MKKLFSICINLLIGFSLFSQTIEFSGTISNDTEWNFDTVKIIGHVIINSGKTLTIIPGTVVEFQGFYGINCSGRLICNGTPEKNIVFTINDTTGYNADRSIIGWAGLGFHYPWDGGNYGMNNENAASIVRNCIFEYSRFGSVSIKNFSKINISNCIFRNNYSAEGAGIRIENSNVQIDSCIFNDNFSYSAGGAAFISSANPNISNSCFINNYGSQGGAIYILQSSTKIVGCILDHNSASNGGGLYFHGFTGFLANSIICNNNAFSGGGAIYGGSGYPLIVNNTICDNSAGYAPGVFAAGDYYFYNTIFWNNLNNSTDYEEIYLSSSFDRPIVTYCVIRDCDKYDPSLFTEFENNSNNNPNFLGLNMEPGFNRDSIISNYSIDSTSICNDNGTNNFYQSNQLNLDFDIAGNDRISNNTIDIGAIEFQDPNPEIPNILRSYSEYNTITIYPNPAQNQIFVNADWEEILTFELIDMDGNLIKSMTFYKQTRYNLTQLRQGIYIAVIKLGNKILKTKRIVKN